MVSVQSVSTIAEYTFPAPRSSPHLQDSARWPQRNSCPPHQTRSRSALRMPGLSGPPIPCTRTADLAVASPSNRMAHPVTSTVFAHSIALGKVPAGTLSAKQFREVRTCHRQGQVAVGAFLLALTSALLANMDTCGLRRTKSRTRTASTTSQCLRTHNSFPCRLASLPRTSSSLRHSSCRSSGKTAARARPFQHGNGQHPISWQPLTFCLFVGDEDHNNSAYGATG